MSPAIWSSFQPEAEALLTSTARPIVLAPAKASASRLAAELLQTITNSA